MKNIYKQILQTKPTKRQIKKFITSNPTLVLLSDFDYKIVETVYKVGLRPIVLFDSDVFGLFKYTETIGYPLFNVFSSASIKPSTSTTTTCDISTIQKLLNRNQVPVLNLSTVYTNTRYVLPKQLALQSLIRGLTSVGLQPTRFVIVNRDGGIGTGFVNITQSLQDSNRYSTTTSLQDSLSYSTTMQKQESDLWIMKEVLNQLGPSASGIITSDETIDPFLSLLVTDKPINDVELIPETIPQESSMVIQMERQPNPPTLFRSQIHISVHKSIDTLDIPQLVNTLEQAFGKCVKPEYVQDLKPWRVIVASTSTTGTSDNTTTNDTSTNSSTNTTTNTNTNTSTSTKYLGIAILQNYKFPYLDKFAIVPDAQGLGIADMLWDEMLLVCSDTVSTTSITSIKTDSKMDSANSEKAKLFWRSRVGNPANTWYFSKSDGGCRFYIDDHGISDEGGLKEGVEVGQVDEQQIKDRKEEQEWMLFWVGDVDIQGVLTTVRTLKRTF